MEENKRQGLLLIVSGPSGAGKGTVVSRLLEKRPDCILSVSCTTRQPRVGEVDGVNYHFISLETFNEWVNQNKFLGNFLILTSFDRDSKFLSKKEANTL